MARTLIVEMRQLEKSVEQLLDDVLRTGAKAKPGFGPVPMAGDPPTVVLTVVAPDPATEARIRDLPELIAAYGDPEIDQFGRKVG